MRNLNNTLTKAIRLDRPVTARTFELNDTLYSHGPTTDSPNVSLHKVRQNPSGPDLAVQIASWDATPGDHILDLHSFPDTRSISLIFAGGDIVAVRQNPQPDEDKIEILGSIDVGVCAAAWSPDDELVAIATRANTVVLLTREFEPLTDITLAVGDLKVSSHVDVGWGKRETQFKGRGAAKALRDPTMPEHIDEGTLSAFDDGRTTISWRGDGEFFAMNSVLETEPRRRVVRVYSREGVLESVSEPVNGLEAALSWKPSGQLIASTQRRADGGIDVVFFERNGLRHGEFDLRLTKEEAETVGKYVDLAWNVDSTVLAVTLTDRVQLWTTGNYHWYLKQEIMCSGPGPNTDDPADMNGEAKAKIPSTNVPGVLWHLEQPLRLSLTTGDNSLTDLKYKFAVARGSMKPPYDSGLVAVIDGKKLKLTPLRVANVPPPMAFDEIDLPAPAREVRFNEQGTEIMVSHADLTTTKWKCDYLARPVKRATLDVSEKDAQSLPFSELSEGDDFTLSDNGVLRGRDLRIPGCTSFIVTQAHLIYTTASHLVKFVHLREDGGNLEVPPDEPEKDERCRNIERGAKIVTVVPSTYALVLQMPRGNLETIYPRALVLAGIRHNIRARDYRSAFRACRQHRVDMNVLHDYAPTQFMRDVELFVKQVRKTEYLDLFLSSLSEENVAETIYKETLTTSLDEPLTNGHSEEPAQSSAIQVNTSKVNKICDAILAVLVRQSSSALQNIVTAHVCKNPPDLEAGLRLVSDLRQQGKQHDLESAVEHICFLADVNQLYDTALGLYDLDVALLIAQQSQKDPREYLPYLQSLNDLPPMRKEFAIDDDLKRYRKAMSHLYTLQVFDELKSYMAKHDLYSAAIELYRYDSARLTELMRMYADHLSSRNRYQEAGIAYEFVQDYISACDVYRSASMWQECLAAAALAGVSGDELTELATDLAASQEEAKDFSSAATLYLEYLQDLETAAKLLCKAYQFSEATRIIASRGRSELLKSVIDPGLVEASASMTETLAEMKSQLAAQVPRIREVRQKKTENPMAFLGGGGGDEDADIPDDISIAPTDASTTGTFMTRYTNQSTGTLATNATRKTSRNRRREERKRARGKKGTVYEEEYLVNSVARLIERLNLISGDVSRLVEGLMRRAMRERAVAVEVAMRDVLEACQACMGEVFPTATNAEGNGATEEQVQDRPWGGQGVMWESMAATEVKREAPVLKAYERLSLLQ